ncbi:MAG: hypothetical protein ACRCUE_06865 [Bosea sp. (in: a-proteobacteria)]
MKYHIMITGCPRFARVLAITCGTLVMAGVAFAQPKPPVGNVPSPKPVLSLPAKAPAAQSIWEGRWSGSFGARSDVSVTFSGERITGVSFVGQPLTVTSTSVNGGIATMSGPDFSMTLTRIGPASAQGIYENNRKEKAAVLLNKG